MRAALIVLALAGTAHADTAVAGAKALVAAQAKASGGDDFGKTFAADGLFLFEGHAVTGPAAVADLYSNSDTFEPAILANVKGKATHVVVGAIGDDAAWLTADLAFTGQGTEEAGTARWSVAISELVVRTDDGWKVQAAQAAEPIKDKDAKDQAGDATSDAIPGAVDDADHASAIGIASIVAALGTDKAVAVIGSAPKERATGAAKVKKLLKKWTKLPFTVNGGVRWVEGQGWAYAAARVDLVAGDVTIPYDVLVIFDGTSVVCVHYAFADTAT